MKNHNETNLVQWLIGSLMIAFFVLMLLGLFQMWQMIFDLFDWLF